MPPHDAQGSSPTGAWRLEIVGGGEPIAYAGPFVVDRNHPLTQGLSLEGAIWSGRVEPQLGGAPVIMAGSVPLLSDHRDGAGRHTLRMNFALDQSNLQDLPDWPILFTNLLRWQRTLLPGIVVPNVRLGQTVGVALADDARQAEVLKPDGSSQKLDVHNRRVEVPAERVGTYTVMTPGASHQFSCNAVSRDESDLSACQSGRWGDWNDSPVHEDRRVSIGWAVLLGAMACLAVHAMVIARQFKRDAP